MPQLQLVMGVDEVNAFVSEHGLVDSFVPITHALLQHGGMSNGQPCVMLVFEHEGKKFIAKTSLQLLETMTGAMRGASGMPRDP